MTPHSLSNGASNTHRNHASYTNDLSFSSKWKGVPSFNATLLVQWPPPLRVVSRARIAKSASDRFLALSIANALLAWHVWFLRVVYIRSENTLLEQRDTSRCTRSYRVENHSYVHESIRTLIKCWIIKICVLNLIFKDNVKWNLKWIG